MAKIGKYALDSKEQAQTKIDALGTQTDKDGNTYPAHKHSIVHLGNIVLEQGTYDEDGNEVAPPVLSDKYHVDVLWDLPTSTTDEDGNVIITDHPYGWKTYSVDLDGEGIHSFMGVKHSQFKF